MRQEKLSASNRAFTEEFSKEAEAIDWIKEKLKGKGEEKTAAPTATPAAGAVASGTTVALASATPDTVIRYTTDGTAPTESSAAYSTPIEITAETTIKAIATAEGPRRLRRDRGALYRFGVTQREAGKSRLPTRIYRRAL